MTMPDLTPNTALLLIDVQQAFLNPEWGERNNPSAEANISRLLEAWRRRGQPILHVVHDSTEPDSLLRPERPGNSIQTIAIPWAGEPVYRKRVNSAFIGTSLERDLRSYPIEALVIVGLTTNHCVSTSARMASNLRFRTYIVSDATAAFARRALDGSMRSADSVHTGALSDLDGEFGTVVTTAALLE